MKKKEVEISKNISSGAEKVESIAAPEEEKVVKKVKTENVTLGSGGKKTIQKEKKTAEKESEAAKHRVERALKKEKAKEARKAEWEQRKQKYLEKRKALLEEIKKEERRLEQKQEERRRERAHAKANKRQNRIRKNKRERGEKKERRSNGGWIAAVVTLGVATLALGTTVTVGSIEMSKTNKGIIGGHRGTMYELTGIMENVENDLDRIRISESAEQQSRILTDLLVQTRIAETNIEKLPVSVQEDQNISAFLNNTARACEGMLGKLRSGEKLSQKDKELLAHLYEVNHTVREELSNIVSTMSDKDISEYIKKGKGKLFDAIDKMEKATMEENRMTFSPNPPQQPKQDEAHIQPAEAEELCKRYFSDYKIDDFQCIGETVSRGYTAYNVQGYDDKGTLLFAELSQENGELLRFDYYEDCVEENFDIANAERIAESFLEKLGYDDMEVARVRENGTTSDFSFVYEDEDVLFYPDEILIKVCRTRGVVTGMDATKYLKNHKDRVEVNPKISLAEAYDKLYKELSVETSRLTVVKTVRGERPAYEFLCSYGENKYLVYLDADTGNEISIVNVNNLR